MFLHMEMTTIFRIGEMAYKLVTMIAHGQSNNSNERIIRKG